jgi:hypothetical protein
MRLIAVLALAAFISGSGVATELGVVYSPRSGEELKADLDAMCEAGITAVMTGESPYLSDWPQARELVVEAKARNIKVALLTAADWFPVTQYDGVSSAAVKPDGSPGLSFSYACRPAEADVAGAVGGFVRKFRLYNNVFHFNLVNEVWAWEDRSTWAEQDFRQYLRALAPDIAYWNKRWDTSFAGFDDVTLKAMPDKGTLRNDFDVYRSDAYARFYSSVYRQVKSAVPPHCSISAQKLYPNYYSNHSTDSRNACLDFHKLFRQHLCNEAWSCHEYGWGSIAAKASKARTVNGVWKRPIIVTESWGGATDDLAAAQSHWNEALGVFRMAKVVYDPDVIFIYQWKWIADKPEWRKQLKDEIAPLLQTDLGNALCDDVGILDARVVYYDFDPSSEESYWAMNEAASAAGVLATQVYQDESRAYSLGKPAFEYQPSVLLVPWDRDLYPKSIFEGYEGTVVRYGPGKPSPESIRKAVEDAEVRTYITEFSKPPGVYEQLYRKGEDFTLAVYNSTGETVKVSYKLRLDKPTTSKAALLQGPDYATVSVTHKPGKHGGEVEAEIPPYGAGLYRL